MLEWCGCTQKSPICNSFFLYRRYLTTLPQFLRPPTLLTSSLSGPAKTTTAFLAGGTTRKSILSTTGRRNTQEKKTLTLPCSSRTCFNKTMIVACSFHCISKLVMGFFSAFFLGNNIQCDKLRKSFRVRFFCQSSS